MNDTPKPPVQEAELHAYVDGRLDPERRAAVLRHLQADPAMAVRVAEWQAHRDTLQQALAGHARAPVPATLNLATLAEARLSTMRRATRWRLVAGVGLALMAGGAGGWLARGPQSPSEIARLSLEAVSAYHVFANDAAPVELASNNPAAFTAFVTQRLGRPVAVPDLSQAGYHLLGGRMLAAMYGPAAMLVYEDARHTRLTVYMQPMRRGETTAMRPLQAGSVDGYAWINRQIGFSVMSQGDPSRLHAIADQVRDSLGW